MRKLTALILICLLTFNWYGYRVLLQFLEERSNTMLQAKLDNAQYDPRDLVELRLPLNLPYLNDQNEFETYEGETIIDGRNYRYVMRKWEKGELVLLCVPNQDKDKLEKAGTDFYKQVNELPSEKKSKNNYKVVKGFSNDYTCIELEVKLNGLKDDRFDFPPYRFLYSSIDPATPSQPPNA